MLGGCYSVRYEYVELSGDNVVIADVARPKFGSLSLGDGKIPVRYEIEEPDVSLTITLAPHTYLQRFEIESSVPITAVSVIGGYAIRQSAFAYTAGWTLTGPESHAGEPFEISVDLEGRAEPITISGVVTEWGKYYRTSDL